VKGEPLAPPAGRADDFIWPRREIGREPARGDTPVAASSPGGTMAVAPGPQKQLLLPAPQPLQQQQRRPQPLQPQIQVRPAQTGPPTLREFFGFGAAPRPPAPTAAPPRAPGPPGAPRPPGSVGRSAEAAPGNVTR
jgi:uncharacterized protein